MRDIDLCGKVMFECACGENIKKIDIIKFEWINSLIDFTAGTVWDTTATTVLEDEKLVLGCEQVVKLIQWGERMHRIDREDKSKRYMIWMGANMMC